MFMLHNCSTNCRETAKISSHRSPDTWCIIVKRDSVFIPIRAKINSTLIRIFVLNCSLNQVQILTLTLDLLFNIQDRQRSLSCCDQANAFTHLFTFWLTPLPIVSSIPGAFIECLKSNLTACKDFPQWQQISHFNWVEFEIQLWSSQVVHTTFYSWGLFRRYCIC